MNKIVNIGIIGCGWIAEHAHIPVLIQKSNVKIVAAFDTYLEQAKVLCEKYNIPNAYENIDEFLECDLKGVIISTPNYTHYTYTMKVLSKGIGVLCEKPIALKTVEIEEILQKAKEMNVVYAPGFVNRWRQDIQCVYQEIQNGTIGEVKKVEAGWLRKSGVPRPGTWFTFRKYAGGGVLTDLGSHIVDLCLLFIGDEKPRDVKLSIAICNYDKIKNAGSASWFERKEVSSLEIDVEETAVIDVIFENDLNMNVKLSWRAPVTADCTYFKMTGTKGSIELKTLFGFSDDRLWKEDSLMIHSEQGEKTIPLNREDNNSKNAFHEMLSYYVDALLAKETDFKNYQGALNTVSLIEKLYACETLNEDEVYDRLLEEI